MWLEKDFRGFSIILGGGKIMAYAIKLDTKEVVEIDAGFQALADSLCIETEEEAEALILNETGADVVIYGASSKEEALQKALERNK
jgi:hypothetical protein